MLNPIKALSQQGQGLAIESNPQICCTFSNLLLLFSSTSSLPYPYPLVGHQLISKTFSSPVPLLAYFRYLNHLKYVSLIFITYRCYSKTFSNALIFYSIHPIFNCIDS